jgi:phage shock protein PspC (stress-responsive transcriptional regulator)
MDRDDARRGRRALSEWTRSPEERRIAGVCAGLARQLEVPVTLVRAAFVLLTVLPGLHATGLVAYAVLWFLMPAAPGEPSGLDRAVDAFDAIAGRDRADDARDRRLEE